MGREATVDRSSKKGLFIITTVSHGESTLVPPNERAAPGQCIREEASNVATRSRPGRDAETPQSNFPEAAERHAVWEPRERRGDSEDQAHDPGAPRGGCQNQGVCSHLPCSFVPLQRPLTSISFRTTGSATIHETLKKQFEKTENDLKALQSVGQIIGEVLKRLDDDRFIVKASSGPRYVVGCRKS